MSVFPVPGGPNNSKPLGGPRKPLNISLHKEKTLNCKIFIDLSGNSHECAFGHDSCQTILQYVRSQHGPNDNLFDNSFSKLQSSDIVPVHGWAVVHYLCVYGAKEQLNRCWYNSLVGVLVVKCVLHVLLPLSTKVRILPYTRKNAQLVTNLLQACWDKLVARFIRTACSSLLTSCYKLAADLLQA